ncbi:nitrogenase-stabilizing/protective protein [Rhodovulum bhavnagarense]|uniref:Nitrogenase-stabilizing/protective protein NifW n=1 Tax=Rhodovulum bhavnagarense TaxID=992286 RepID=A0A4R2RGK1_9RHOB|nr:nitrogenase-stabilizing/protective protein NifW [Rhodovulum bhavnagarense]TCP61698.1 nitrogenase-stabilizing/protective protein [Rhodovulum bhavnagarense]
MTNATRPGVLDQMRALSSAEDMFAFLDLDYDPSVLNRARLHVMKRMGDYLAKVDLGALDEEAIRAEAQKALCRAHQDFVNSSPRQQKALKIYARSRGNIVPLEGLLPISR